MSTALIVTFIVLISAFALFWLLPKQPKSKFPQCDPLNLDIPKDLNRKFHISSEGGYGKTYKVNPYKWVCNCAEFKATHRGVFRNPRTQPCIHMREALLQSGAAVGTPYEPMLKERRDANCFHYPDEETVIGFTPGRSWIDIYARSEEASIDFRRYGYDIDQRCWTAAQRPSNFSHIEKQVQRVFH